MRKLADRLLNRFVPKGKATASPVPCTWDPCDGGGHIQCCLSAGKWHCSGCH